MNKLNLPDFDSKLKTNPDGKVEIYDRIRKKYIYLTPEENVRQAFINYLVNYKDFPASLIAVEKGLKVNNLFKRTDIVMYDNTGNARVIVECKAPNVKITEDVFAQAAMYNMKMKVDYLIITNGMKHYCCKVNYKDSKLEYLKEVPSFKKL